MATRIGGGDPSVFIPPGAGSDTRSDQRREQMVKELQERELVRTRGQAEHVVDQVLRRLQPDGGGLRVAPLNPDGTRPGEKRPDDKPRTDGKARDADGRATRSAGARAEHKADARPRTDDVPRAVADFQRDNKLPVSGRLDAETLQLLQDKGLITLAPEADAPHATPAQKTQATASEQQGARKLHVLVEKDVKVRAEQHEPRADRVLDKGRDVPRPAARADAAPDPARLFASLVTAGFLSKKASLEDGVKAFQATFGLPMSGTLDEHTTEALKSQGLLDSASGHGPPPADANKLQNVKRALAEPVKSAIADHNVDRDTTRAQASTHKPTTTNDVAARAPSTAASADPADKMRLDTVLAQQQATERGVQEQTGDPSALRGQGATEGKGAGAAGSGGTEGGGAGATGDGARAAADGPAGDESAVGNSKAGDDDFLDEARGHASAGLDAPVPDPNDGEGHYEVPPLSEQVATALATIARDDDRTGPVTYTWDVTFFRPGIYGAHQPAEEIWRVVVSKATAFDPVWQQAADAIASKMLYMEPDGQPPTIDDFVHALKRARVA